MFFTKNIIQKLISLAAAIVIWALVNHSITTTKLFPRVSCRIVNMPPDKTIRGLMPNGMLDRKIILTLTGRKDVVESLESNDFEVVIDAASKKGDEWIVQVTKKNLVSLNPDVDLIHNITHVSHNEFALRLSRLVTEKVPVYFTIPQGEPPAGYQFLDITPQMITHTISGPEEDVAELMNKGCELKFNLSNIMQQELDALYKDTDEVCFTVPHEWMKIQVPFLGGMQVPIHDSHTKQVVITFLRNKLLRLEHALPLTVFYPASTRDRINPVTCTIDLPPSIEMKNGVMVINKELFVADVSRLFLDIVRDRMEVLIILDATHPDQPLSWDIQFIDPEDLENRYVACLLTEQAEGEDATRASLASSSHRVAEKERYLRLRFREYMQRLKLFMNQDKPFHLECYYRNDKLVVGEL